MITSSVKHSARSTNPYTRDRTGFKLTGSEYAAGVPHYSSEVFGQPLLATLLPKAFIVFTCLVPHYPPHWAIQVPRIPGISLEFRYWLFTRRALQSIQCPGLLTSRRRPGPPIVVVVAFDQMVRNP